MDTKPIKEGTILWEPGEDVIKRANMTRYMQWLASQKGLTFQDYPALWQWSVTEIEDFWQSLWEFFGIRASRSGRALAAGPGCKDECFRHQCGLSDHLYGPGP